MTHKCTLWFCTHLSCGQFTVAKPLRIFYHKPVLPCELHRAWLSYDSSIRCFSICIEVVFAFLIFSKDRWAVNPNLLIYVNANLLRCATSVATFLVRNIIQHTSYFLPCELLSGLSRTLEKHTGFTRSRRFQNPFRLQYNLLVLAIRSYRYPFSYQFASWFVVKSPPRVTFHWLTFPSRASKPMFFPQHLLRCYLTRSYQIRLPFGEWAGLFG